jgi:hypothetical protein
MVLGGSPPRLAALLPRSGFDHVHASRGKYVSAIMFVSDYPPVPEQRTDSGGKRALICRRLQFAQKHREIFARVGGCQCQQDRGLDGGTMLVEPAARAGVSTAKVIFHFHFRCNGATEITLAVKPLEEAAAKERQREGGKRGGEASGKFPEAPKAQTRDKVGAFAGYSGRHYAAIFCGAADTSRHAAALRRAAIHFSARSRIPFGIMPGSDGAGSEDKHPLACVTILARWRLFMPQPSRRALFPRLSPRWSILTTYPQLTASPVLLPLQASTSHKPRSCPPPIQGVRLDTPILN